MSNLTAFLSQNALKVENVKYVASKRFINGKGKPEEWELKCIDSKENERLKKQCAKITRLTKRDSPTLQTDYDVYLGKLVVACTVYPNLNDAELQNSYGAMGAEELIKTMLTPGEYIDLVNKVQDINGYDREFDEAVEEAKN